MDVIEVKPREQKAFFAGVNGGLDVVIVNPDPTKSIYIRVHAQSIVVSRRKSANYGRPRQ
jgi:hypothetical protein